MAYDPISGRYKPDTPKTVTQRSVGSVAPESGLTVTGSERNFAKEAEARRIGYSAEYILSRGGINAQGYFNDTPLSGQLSATEQKQVTLPNGTTDTVAMARILQQKQIAELISQGVSEADATRRVSTQYGEYGINVGPAGISGSNLGGSATGGYDASGKPIAGGQYNAQGQYVGTGTGGISSERRDAFQAIINALAPYGLEGLGSTIEQLMKDPSVGANTAVFKLKYDTSINPTTGKPWNTAYQTRFPANIERINAGKPALSESEYLTAERTYAQVLTSYGVSNLATKANFNKFIAGDVSATEVGDRVATAIDRVQNASAVTKDALAKYYPKLSQLDVVSAVLDPTIGVPELKRKIQLAEIGGAATLLGAGLTPEERSKLILSEARAGELAAAGVTGEQARRGYEAIGGFLQRGSQLADIYKQQAYTQQTAEQEIFGLQDSVMASQRRKKLTELETAQFGAKSGLTGGALQRDRAGQF
jgi:hypothetical protein